MDIITQDEVINLVTQKAQQLGMPVFLVGGIVRDHCSGSSNDLDLVVKGRHHAGSVTGARLRGKVTTHTRFRTATIDIGFGSLIRTTSA
jgi:tRNA nucleotidyltransferase/poly(A) polymerase